MLRSKSILVGLTLVAMTSAMEARAQLQSGLQGYWQADGNGRDSSGFNRDLSVLGGLGVTSPGIFGSSFDFGCCVPPGQPHSPHASRPGVDDQVFDFGTGDFTIQVWVYWETLDDEQVLIEKLSDSGGWTLTKLNGTDGLRFTTTCGGIQVGSFGPFSPALNTWHQVVVRRLPTTEVNLDAVQIFLDGQRLATKNFVLAQICDTSSALLIGRRFNRPEWTVSGRLDEIAIWNRALSAFVIESLWNGGAGRLLIDCNINGIPDGIELDTDGDGVIDDCDDDDDNDGIVDASDSNPFNPDICEDTDADGCDDCAVGTDDFGPLPDNDPSNDGTDTDGDGLCDAGDLCPFDNPDDPDADGVCTSDDNCDLFNPVQADCQPNAVGDVCDIANGTSEDCNVNGIPDECDLTDMTSEDCNTNATPDECDIARGVSGDCNINGIPDECEAPNCPASLDLLTVNGGGQRSSFGMLYSLVASTGQPGGVGLTCTGGPPCPAGVPGAYDMANGFWHAINDNCPADINPFQTDTDKDGKGDLCDPCPADAADACNPGGSTGQEFMADTGGTLVTPDGLLTLVVEPGDLAQDTTLSVTDTVVSDPEVDLIFGPNPGLGRAVAVYDLQPDGLTFNSPLTLTVVRDVSDLNANQRSKLTLYIFTDTDVPPDGIEDTFVEIAGTVCTVVENPMGVFIATCVAEIEHFTSVGVVGPLDSDNDGVPDDFDGVVDNCLTMSNPDQADGNCNGIGDACDVSGLPDPPGAELLAQPGDTVNTINRFVSIMPGNVGLQTAIRVTFDNLPVPFDTLNGQSMWVGPPNEICENSGQNELVPINECGPAIGLPIISGDPGPTLFVAFLQCDPFYMDWSTIPKPININSEFIVPSGTYNLQAVNQSCSPADESSFSAPLIITNTIWGDLVGLSCLTSETCSAPDGVVGITSDVSAVLEMFKNTNFAPGKARSDVEPSILDFKINFTDVTLVLDAFSSEPYPHAPSTTNPCP